MTAASPAKPSMSRRPAAKQAASKQTGSKSVASPAAVDARFANGPLAVLDGDGSAYCVGGLVLDCPAKTFPTLVDWALTEAKLGAPRLHRHGKDADPLIVLTDEAAERLGLPAVLEDRRGLRLPDDHKVIKQLTKAKWKLTKRGFGPGPGSTARPRAASGSAYSSRSCHGAPWTPAPGGTPASCRRLTSLPSSVRTPPASSPHAVPRPSAAWS